MKVNIENYSEQGEKQAVEVRIDPWDTWSMDHTLSHIIHPMLVQLKNTKHGSPHVDDEDVPDNLRSTSAAPKENDWDSDEFFHQRWDYVLDEMIYAFEQIKSGNYDSEFYGTDESKIVQDPQSFSEMTAHMTFDHAKIQQKQARISNGCRLFGRYLQCLWD